MPVPEPPRRVPKYQRYISPWAWIGSEVNAGILESQIARAASAEGPVLILGEPGTGKRLSAQLIHGQSSHGGCFVACRASCRGIPANFREYELFGGMTSPFQESFGPPAGRIEQARLGTCFLEGIDELSADGQQLLLRYFQTGEVQCLSTWFRPPPTRVVVAVTRDLQEVVAAGEFREDLHALLTRNTVVLPALRERRADILPIFMHYVDAYAYWTHRPMPAISPATAAALSAHTWPGNVDEIKQAAARTVLTGTLPDLLDQPACTTGNWRQLVEMHWTDDHGGKGDVISCGIYLTGAGMQVCTNEEPTRDVYTNLITAQCAARAARRDFLLAGRRYEEFVSAAYDW